MIDEAIRDRVLAIYRSGIPVKLIFADYEVSHTQLYRWLHIAGMRLRYPQKTNRKRQLDSK